jgi:uncharacterized protein YxjI
MTARIEFLSKKAYGRVFHYPISNDAKTLCKIIKRATLTNDQLKICKDAGWIVEQNIAPEQPQKMNFK